jgi:hypothetical protein
MDLNSTLKKINAVEKDEFLSVHKKTNEMRIKPVIHTALPCFNESSRTPKRKRLGPSQDVNEASNVFE